MVLLKLSIHKIVYPQKFGTTRYEFSILYLCTGSPDLPSSHERTHTVSASREISPPSGVVENPETMSCVYIGSCEVPQSQGEYLFVYLCLYIVCLFICLLLFLAC